MKIRSTYFANMKLKCILELLDMCVLGLEFPPVVHIFFNGGRGVITILGSENFLCKP